MFSVRGPKLKIFAGILAVIVLIVGVYMTFFQSRGFVKTTASITDVRMDSTGESAVYYPTVEYTVDGKTYTTELDTGSKSYRIGQTISVLYDPGNPSVAHDGGGFRDGERRHSHAAENDGGSVLRPPGDIDRFHMRDSFPSDG